jgi:hypothetical protein
MTASTTTMMGRAMRILMSIVTLLRLRVTL